MESSLSTQFLFYSSRVIPYVNDHICLSTSTSTFHASSQIHRVHHISASTSTLHTSSHAVSWNPVFPYEFLFYSSCAIHYVNDHMCTSTSTSTSTSTYRIPDSSCASTYLSICVYIYIAYLLPCRLVKSSISTRFLSYSSRAKHYVNEHIYLSTSTSTLHTSSHLDSWNAVFPRDFSFAAAVLFADSMSSCM